MHGQSSSKNNFTLKPTHCLFAYIALILGYTIIYYFIPNDIKLPDDNELTLIKSLYFSVVTITTLGYGDYLPQSNLAMLIVASEAFLGVVTIGLFLSSLWQTYANHIEEKQSIIIKQRLSEQNLKKILSFYSYIDVVIMNYKTSFAEVTTPLGQRGSKIQLNENFVFSDLIDIFGPSLLIKNGTSKPVYYNYFSNLDFLCMEFKFLLSTFDFTEYPHIQKNLIVFLTYSRGYDVRKALESFDLTSSHNPSMKETMNDLIKTCEPVIEDYPSNIVTPVIIFYQALKIQLKLIMEIEENFQNLIGEN